MTAYRINRGVLAVLAVLVAAGCTTTRTEEPRVVTREVVVTKPVACPALSELGEEPTYPDTAEALDQAEGIGPLAQLYRMGRLLRDQRLSEYITARAACEALDAE